MIEVDHKHFWTEFINGDDEALHQLYTRFVDVLYSFGMRFSDDSDLVKDCIQDLFVDLYKYRFTLAPDVQVKSYLFTSLKRKICYVLKKRTKEQKAFELPFLIATEDEYEIENDNRSEMQHKLEKQLNLLPVRQKEAIYLRYHLEMDYEEIAVIMNISTATCRTLVYRGIKQLRERMVIKHLYKYLAILFLIFLL